MASETISLEQWLMSEPPICEKLSELSREMYFNGASIHSDSDWFEAMHDYYMRFYGGVKVKIKKYYGDGTGHGGDEAVLFVGGAAQLILAVGYWPPEEVEKLFEESRKAEDEYYDIPCFYKIGEFVTAQRNKMIANGKGLSDQDVFLKLLPSNIAGKRIYEVYFP